MARGEHEVAEDTHETVSFCRAQIAKGVAKGIAEQAGRTVNHERMIFACMTDVSHCIATGDLLDSSMYVRLR